MDDGNQILIAVTQLQTTVGSMSEQLKEISKIGTVVVEVVESNKAVHHRVADLKTEMAKQFVEVKQEHIAKSLEMKTDFDKKLSDQKVDYEEKLDTHKDNFKDLKGDIKWLWRTVVAGGIAFIFSAILYAIKLWGG